MRENLSPNCPQRADTGPLPEQIQLATWASENVGPSSVSTPFNPA